jgi:hypothetical protein
MYALAYAIGFQDGIAMALAFFGWSMVAGGLAAILISVSRWIYAREHS